MTLDASVTRELIPAANTAATTGHSNGVAAVDDLHVPRESVLASTPVSGHKLDAGLFVAVRTVQACIAAFEKASLFDNGDLPVQAVNQLSSLCLDFRRRGLALEPNLIGRAIVHAISEPFRAGAVAQLFSSDDTDFRALFREADDFRDRSSFPDAEFIYWKALCLYPKHPPTLVQYAHCLKEQRKFPDALCHYLDALHFGANVVDVEEHVMFVANVTGDAGKVQAKCKCPSSLLSSSDLRLLFEVLLGHAPSQSDLLGLVLNHDSPADAAASLIRHPAFCATNFDLLRLVQETGKVATCG
jgi:hypothetical protein